MKQKGVKMNELEKKQMAIELKQSELTLDKKNVEFQAFKIKGAKGWQIRSPWFSLRRIEIDDK